MNKIHQWLEKLPTTQYRILVSTLGFAAVVIVGVILGKPIQEGVLWFILGWGFNDVVQFSAKRFSQKEVPSGGKESE